MKYFIANWKMNMGIKEVVAWVESYSRASSKIKNTKVIIAPSTPHLPLLSEVNQRLNFEISAQDVSAFEKGAHTGEIGTFQIKEFCKYSIVGHSERKESFDTVIAKRDFCLKEGITPIVCFVKTPDAPKLYKAGVILAWEDPSNISLNGTYRDKDPKEVAGGVAQIRSFLPEEAILIYGGSVNRENIKDLAKIQGIDGVLVGNASLDPNHFIDIILSCL